MRWFFHFDKDNEGKKLAELKTIYYLIFEDEYHESPPLFEIIVYLKKDEKPKNIFEVNGITYKKHGFSYKHKDGSREMYYKPFETKKGKTEKPLKALGSSEDLLKNTVKNIPAPKKKNGKR